MSRVWEKNSFLQTIPLIPLLLVWIMLLVSNVKAQHLSKNLLYTIGWSQYPETKLYLLYIMPNGQIIDAYQQWAVNGETNDIAITPDKNYLYVGTRWTIEGFRIDPMGTLYAINTISCGIEDMFVTLNGKFLIAGGANKLFQIDSIGNLIDTYTQYTSNGPTLGLNPRGNPLIVNYEYDLWVYHLNYDSATLTLMTTINWGAPITPWKIAFTPDGSLGLMNGYLFPSYDVMVLKVDTTESVSSTGQKWNFGSVAADVTISPDGRFGLVAMDTAIYILAIDTVNGTITDTGKRFRPVNDFLSLNTRFTEDGKLVVITYVGEPAGTEDWITTAFFDSEGNLIWTGYTFPFGATYIGSGDQIQDIELVPVYVTGVESFQWQLYE